MADTKKSKSTRKTSRAKYNETTIKGICKTLSETGSDVAAYSSVGVGKSTFYSWLKTKDDFASRVASARVKYVDSNRHIFRDLALNSMYLALRDGCREYRKVTVKEIGANNKLVTTKETTYEVNKGVPQWIIEKVLGANISEMDAVKVLMESGWFDNDIVSEIAENGAEFEESVREIILKHATLQKEDRLEAAKV